MRSWRESFSFTRPSSTVESLPRKAHGLLSHQDEEELQNLWIEIRKSEDEFKKLNLAIQRYKETVKNLQETEEKLIKGMQESNVQEYLPSIGEVCKEYDTVIENTRCKSDSLCHLSFEVVGQSLQQYSSLYKHLDVTRKRRDTYVMDLEKYQDKIDKLKLKGKRTTDVRAERDKTALLLKEANTILLKESNAFHDARIPWLELCQKTLLQAQIDYYGSTATEYNAEIHASRGHHLIKDQQYSNCLNDHLQQIRKLTIVE